MRGLQGDLQNAGFQSDALLAPEQALTLYFARAQLLAPKTEAVPLERAWGRVLAKPIAAGSAQPAIARSAMDGFAVRSHDTPSQLRIAGEIRMGELWPGALEPGTAVRIPTGGALPSGADAVVPIEDARVEGEAVHIAAAIAAGDCIVPAGSDMLPGETIVEEGRRIGGAELGVLAALGIVDVPVFAVPTFAIISSGDELIDVRSRPHGAQVPDSNRWALAGKLQALGAAAKHYPIAPDEEAAYEKLLRAAHAECDGVILSGGSSVGLRDLTPRLIDRLGEPGVIVHGLRVKPGKPTVLAAVAGKPVVGLPGNPTSALMILEAVAAPIVAHAVGALARAAQVEATLARAVRKRAGWTQYVPVRLEESGGIFAAHPLEMYSASVSLLARASGFLTLGESVESVAAGDTVLATRFL
ncbi:MAG TPA: molybdopterin molybdotransferase MoeA [Candidatus Rubrimentiphilum sp.]|nr:molybdopterin molybdotransferase MoeA [Candidatus Rubrimentiphilum sp.]